MTDDEGKPRSRDDRDTGSEGGRPSRHGPRTGRGHASARGRSSSGSAGGRDSGSSRPAAPGPRKSQARQSSERGRQGGPRRPGDRDIQPSNEKPSGNADLDPSLPEGINLTDLPRGMKAELKGLPPEIADKVGLRLIAAGTLLEVDPGGAYAQAKVARRLAARLPVVRAVVAEAAYGAGDYQAALTDYRALRRMTGDDAYLPVIADCERALGRPDEVLKLAREASTVGLDPALAIEMRMVEAGARSDLGQRSEALRLLEREIEISQRARGLNDTSKARLRYAYADHLVAQGERAKAREWFVAAAKLDRDGMTDADERVAELDGLVIEFDETDETNEERDVGERSEGRNEKGQ